MLAEPSIIWSLQTASTPAGRRRATTTLRLVQAWATMTWGGCSMLAVERTVPYGLKPSAMTNTIIFPNQEARLGSQATMRPTIAIHWQAPAMTATETCSMTLITVMLGTSTTSWDR